MKRAENWSIDKDELNAMAEEVAERTGNEIDVDSLMEAYEGDGDGVLNQEETQSAMESIKDQMGPPDGKIRGPSRGRWRIAGPGGHRDLWAGRCQ